MKGAAAQSHTCRFAGFELDLRSGELRKEGRRLRLQEQPFQVLRLLLENPGDVVTREELRQKLWPGDTFVDFDHGLNNAVNRLRDLLSDSSEKPRFIETLPRRGYRFIAVVSNGQSATSQLSSTGDSPGAGQPTVSEQIEKPRLEVTIKGASQMRRRKPRLLAVAVVIAGASGLAVLGVVLILGRQTGSSSAPSIRELQLITSSDHDSSPAVSPDGRKVAFSSDRDGVRRIWLKDLSSGTETALTTIGTDNYPRFSPDGSQLVFTRGVNTQSLYRVATRGGEEQKLLEDADYGDWAPDGREVVFVRHAGATYTIGAVQSEGAAIREIVKFQTSAPLAYPRWSPDGRTIALRKATLSNRNDPWSVLLVDAAGKSVRSIPSPQGGSSISSVIWLENGNEILYSQALPAAGGTLKSWMSRVVRQNINSGVWKAPYQIPYRSETLDLFASGRLILDSFSSRQNLRENSIAGARPHQERWLTRGGSQDSQPVYSPDGAWVLFTSNRSGNLDLWEISPTTAALRKITDDPSDDWDPAFTSDGRILWTSNRSGHPEIWMANADGGSARQISHDDIYAAHPTATGDGQWVFYESRNPELEGLWKIRPDGSGAFRILERRCGVTEASPDGGFVWCYRRWGLGLVRTGDGAELPWAINGRWPRWIGDGRRFAFQGWNAKGASGVFVQDFDPSGPTTETRRAIAGFSPEMTTESYGIAPDGTRITISSTETFVNLMVTESMSGIAPVVRQKR